MSHLLKRTKKSCLKLLRKISTSKQLFAQKLEEDDLSTCHVVPPSSCGEEVVKHDGTQTCHTNPKTQIENDTESTTATNAIHTVQYTLPQDQEQHSDVESLQFSTEENQNNAIIHGLTAKFFLGADGYEFQRLQQLRSDAASEVLDYEFDWPPIYDDIKINENHNDNVNSYDNVDDNNNDDDDDDDADSNKLTVHFEKVHYRQNVRYLRHTPSSSCIDLPEEASNSHATDLLIQKHNNRYYNNGNYVISYHQRGRRSCSISLGTRSDRLDGNATPVIKWDINGNSLDDYYNDIGDMDDDFNSKWNRLQDKRLTQLTMQHADNSQKSSYQSSVCTLETWLDNDLELAEQPSVLNEKILPNYNLCLK